MPASRRARRGILVIACLAAGWALVARYIGGVDWRLGPLRVSSNDPLRPMVIAAAAAILYLLRIPRADAETDGRWLDGYLVRARRVIVPLVILSGCVVGIRYGSFTAAGSDSYGYVSQAALWLKGSLLIPQPWVQQFSWPEREWTFAPLGYRPLGGDGTIVPTYPPGLPILMAVFLGVFGANGPFFVVPLLASLALWATYALGREATDSRAVGAGAACLLLASPVFLAHAMLPMTDVPVAAGWAVVCLTAIKRPRPRPVAAGLLAAFTLLIRPNLVLLALVPAAACVTPALRRRIAWNEAFRYLVRFALGLSPAVVAVAALNAYLYGSPLESGYGQLTEMYALGSAWPNLRNYGTWLVATETPLVVLAVIPLFAQHALRSGEHSSSALAALIALVASTLASYLFYSPFEGWFYLRYMLPALPAILVLLAAGVRWCVSRAPRAIRTPAAALVVLAVALHGFRYSREQFLFNQRDFERRHIRAAQSVVRLTPENAVIVSSQHSGSLRYYAHRMTLRYDSLYDHRLDTTLRELKEKGYRPYIVLDDWEEKDFRRRFAAKNRAGALDWKPIWRELTNPEVRVFDPEGRFE